ncbi:MAG TPA: type II toxin-antitoxin system VapC family toxin [Gemmatimonadaceae bacterium]|nr:type II toxin-antitoxin system VapC family toxin [Gemmatimonadaceae bacterium]
MILLLDTHVWWRYMEGDATLPSPIQRAIDAAVREYRVYVSAHSAWELGMLEAKGRLQFVNGAESWIRQAIALPGMHVKSVTIKIAYESTRLPGAIHGDPADRFLIATARVMGWTLVTADAVILAYANAGHVSVLDARPQRRVSR